MSIAPPPATAHTRESLPWTPQLVRVMAGLMLSLFVAAMDLNVVGTALPTIARELGGFSLYPWIVAGYLLTSTTTVPLWGRLADLRGRRRVVMAGIAVFVGSSVLCGLSPSMLGLVIFRTLQGIGAGCIQPVTLTIVGDIFPVAQRARLQAFFSGMWAVSAVVGPLIGAGFVSSPLGWRWIFGVNVPIGLVATWALFGYREQPGEPGAGGFDVAGAVGLTAGIAALLIGLGTGSANAQPMPLVLVLAAAILVATLAWEARLHNPTLPLDLITHPVIGPALLAALFAGTLMFGMTTYGPLYVQGALGGSAYAAGAAIAPMSVGWPIGSVLTGRLLLRVGYRPLIVAGGVFQVLGALLLALVARSPGGVIAASAVMGFGMGLLATPVLIVIQSTVPWARRGAATALNQLSRTIGGAVGVSLMGVVLQARVGAMGSSALRSGRAAARASLAAGLETIFWLLVAVACATLVTTLGIMLAARRGGARAAQPLEKK